LLTGFDAVSLWQEHQRGSRKALEILVEKLHADASSLPTLAAHAFNALAQRLPLGILPVPVPAYVPRTPRFTVADVVRVLPWKSDVEADVADEIDADPAIARQLREKPSQARGVYWFVTSSPHWDDSVAAYGKWLVFAPRSAIDRVWSKVVTEMQFGELGRSVLQAKVSTARPSPNAMRPSEHVICVYVRRDRVARLRVREILERLRLTRKSICFKTEAATRAGIYLRPRQS
jgi:hypothetical protein